MDAYLAVGATLIIGALAFVYILFSMRNTNGSSSQREVDEAKCDRGDAPKNQAPKAQTKSSKPKVERHTSKSSDFAHPWLVSCLKGHSDQVSSFDLSPNGKYIASTAIDRSMFLWLVKDIPEKNHRSVRGNVEYDCAKLIKFSPDNRSFITSLENGNTVRVFKFNKNSDGSIGKAQQVGEDYPQTHTEEIINIGIDSTGNYIMTADNTTKIDILDLKGEKLAGIDTGTMKNSHACVSPCGRFVAACGFTPDVKVWEVAFDKSKDFKGIKRAFDLKGHKAGVVSLAFSADSARMATVSKDGTWKLWRTDVEYNLGQDPSLISSGNISSIEEGTKIALSPDGRALAISIENNIICINAVSGKEEQVIKSVFSGYVRHMMFSVSGRYLLCCGDRQIKVFHNIMGYRAKVDDIAAQLVSCSKTMERRLTDQLAEAKSTLTNLGF